MRRLASIVRLVGLRPVALTRTFWFLVERRLRQRYLRAQYARAVVGQRADLQLDLPPIELPPASELPRSLVSAATALCEEADAILRHEVDYLGSGPTALGTHIDWHTDFKSGYRWPSDFYLDVRATRLDDASDAKVPWELSRGHQLLTLSRAACLLREARYADEVQAQMTSWLDANPTGFGINWVNPMEVAIRAINWIWALRTLEGSQPIEPVLRHRVAIALCAHARHIRASLEGTPYLRSNHFLADVVGLLVIAAALPGDREASRWLAFAHRNLEREVRREVHEDGVSFEGSLAYHGLALELFLVAHTTAARIGRPFSCRFSQRVRQMLEVSRSVRHPNGRVPLFGDQDSGRILPGGFERPPSHDNLLWLGAAIVGTCAPFPGAADAEVAWTLGLPTWRRISAQPVVKTAPRRSFPAGGIYVLDGDKAHAAVRCGDVGQRGNGGHSHNDALSYELSVGQTLVVVDSGTYAYTSDVAARNRFRATAAHNVVVVDGKEIHPIDPTRVFELRQFARTHVETWREEESRVEFVGCHDGYRRLAPPVHVRRRLVLARGRTAALQVVDELEGRGRHDLASYVHLAAGAQVTLRGAVADVGVGDVLVRIGFVGAQSVTARNGEVSDRYGVAEPAPVLIAQATAQLPHRIEYRIEELASVSRTRNTKKEASREAGTAGADR